MRFDPNAYGENTVMICESESEAETFTKYLNTIGMTWCSGDSYLLYTKWNDATSYDSGIAYYFHEGTFSDKAYAEESEKYECLYFKHFDFGNSEAAPASFLQSSSLDDFLNAFIRKGE